jgi:2,3-bisphosphoglycerate-dependent phosphoglycerate mutase
MRVQQKTPKTVYFLRHGQSVDNVSPVFQSVKSPLSDKGRAQAKLLADRIATLDFDALVTSSLPRAKQTAEFITKATGKTAEVSELFVERIKPESIDGKPWTDEEATKIWREWEKDLNISGIKSKDGETYDAIVARAKQALNYLETRPEANIVVVTHGYFLRTLLATVILGDDMTGKLHGKFQRLVSMENTAICVMQYRDAFEEDFCWRLWTYNDHAHIAK